MFFSNIAGTHLELLIGGYSVSYPSSACCLEEGVQLSCFHPEPFVLSCRLPYNICQEFACTPGSKYLTSPHEQGISTKTSLWGRLNFVKIETCIKQFDQNKRNHHRAWHKRWNIDLWKLNLQDYLCRLDIQRLVWIDLAYQDLVSINLVLNRSILWRFSPCWSSLFRCNLSRSILCGFHPSI